MPPSSAGRAEPRDLADAIAFALRFEGRKRVDQADEYMAAIAAERIVRHLESAGFVAMKRPLLGAIRRSGGGLSADCARELNLVLVVQ